MVPHDASRTPGPAAVGLDQARTLVEARLARILDQQREHAARIHPDAAPVVDVLSRLSGGGKRMRALLAWIGWRAAGGAANAERILTAGAAVELFQTAALVHDDILDRSDTRRGMPSVHRSFEASHRHHGWRHDPEHYGVSAAILAGDVCLALADTTFLEAILGSARPDRALAEMQTMRFEVMVGQYLDVLAEMVPPAADTAAAGARAETVVEYKSARYSAVHPLALGALLAGGDDALVAAFERVTLPFGIAYQYQDDLLGVFGDPDLTGKPAGDDLREGKRTTLIAHAVALLDPSTAAELDADLGRPDLTDERIHHWLRRLTDCGARQRVEDDIRTRLEESTAARAGLVEAGAAEDAVTDLTALMDSLVHRNA